MHESSRRTFGFPMAIAWLAAVISAEQATNVSSSVPINSAKQALHLCSHHLEHLDMNVAVEKWGSCQINCKARSSRVLEREIALWRDPIRPKIWGLFYCSLFRG